MLSKTWYYHVGPIYYYPSKLYSRKTLIKFLIVILSVNQAKIWSDAQVRPTPMTIERLVSFTTICKFKFPWSKIPPTLICLTNLIGAP